MLFLSGQVSVDAAVRRDDREDAAAQDVLILRFIQETLIQVRGLQPPAADKSAHDLKPDSFRCALTFMFFLPHCVFFISLCKR